MNITKIQIKKVFIYILLLIFTAISVYFSYAWGKKAWPFGEINYQIVQLASGEVYYGKLRTFPCCKLSNVYFIQKTQQENEGDENKIQLVSLNSLFFAPKDTIYLSRDQIIWWADLSKESQILKTIVELENK